MRGGFRHWEYITWRLICSHRSLRANPRRFPTLRSWCRAAIRCSSKCAPSGSYAILGQTRDDAAGEAFDKTAKLLGLPYPGGPELAELAEHGHHGVFSFPRPMLDRPGLEFSFSGLKTAVLNAVRDRELTPAVKADIAYAVQEAIVETLVAKALRALDETGLDTLVVSGGVGANKKLRARMSATVAARGGSVFYPRFRILHR